MYKIGQYRRSTQEQYFIPFVKDTNYEIGTQSTTTVAVNDVVFTNPCLNLKGNLTMNNTNCYYIRFEIKKKVDDIQIIRLKLRDTQATEDNEQLIEIFEIGAGDGETVPLEIIIAPNNSYNQIVWELQRTTDDYRKTSRQIQIEIKEFAQLINIMGRLTANNSNVRYLTKIGIQGPPSLLTCINREQIRLGKNGIYELNNNKIKITYIGFVPRSLIDYFILDFEYTQEED